MTLFMQ